MCRYPDPSAIPRSICKQASNLEASLRLEPATPIAGKKTIVDQ
jgi:hypothetical protein